MNILVVDDKPANLLALRKILAKPGLNIIEARSGNDALLAKPGLNIIEARSGNDALALLLEHDFALILLDVQMPDMDGFETAEIIRGNEATKNIPIIFVTAINKEQKYVFEGYSKGAVDYLFKPLDPDILQNKVNIFLELYRQKEDLKNTNIELKQATEKIIEQQEDLIEEERLKVLLQMAGAKALELNQPLASLLEDVELLGKVSDNPDRISECLSNIKTSGRKISDITRKISAIHYNEPLPTYYDSSTIISIDREIEILLVDDSEDVFEIIKAVLGDQDG
ncbi:MAG: response regulator [Planctomycetota bacterium]|jgi:two-component system cell cycle response regulator